MNTYKKYICNPFRMNTYRSLDLKSFRINTYKKQGEGVSPFRYSPRLSGCPTLPFADSIPPAPRVHSSTSNIQLSTSTPLPSASTFRVQPSSSASSFASRAFPCTLEIGAPPLRQTVMPTRPGFRIVTIAGIPIYVHPTWLVIFGLLTWTLVDDYTKQRPEWATSLHWAVGVATSLLLFASVLFHEMAHSLVAQRYKIKVISITLFIFGGVARIEREPSKAIQEFNIAVAGPLASAFLAFSFYLLGSRFPESSMIGNLAILVSGTNALLCGFNLLPGFPLDGGRIFRAIVWGITKDFSRATRAAGFSGKLVAYVMILLGAWRALGKSIVIPGVGTIPGNFVGGLWTAFMGWFILNAAQESVAQVEVRETLSGLRAQDVMSHEVPTFPGGDTLEDYAAEVLRTGRRFHLVLTDDRLTGMMNVHALNGVPQDEWASTSVQGVMVPRENILWARPEEPLLGLLERLLANEVNQMPVVSENGEGDDTSMQIIGMVTRDSILRVIQTRSEVGAESLRGNNSTAG